jgi:hypothetical protein
MVTEIKEKEEMKKILIGITAALATAKVFGLVSLEWGTVMYPVTVLVVSSLLFGCAEV